MMKRAIDVAVGALVLLTAGTAVANPRPLPFSYTYESLPEGALEIEQIVDMTHVKTQDLTGDFRTIPRTTLVTEFEFGLTSRLEAGFYIQLVDEPVLGTDASLRFDGIKERLRYRLAEPGEWPVDVALYGELAQLRNEFEVEAKIILQRRLGRVRVLSNLWVEREFYYGGRREWVFHPTLGAAYEWSPRFSLGLESWLIKEIEDGEKPILPPGVVANTYNTGPIGYVGPTLFAAAGDRGWLSVGAYTRFTQFGRSAQIGDYYGRFWLRVMLGIGL
jgi:hypothetical protein